MKFTYRIYYTILFLLLTKLSYGQTFKETTILNTIITFEQIRKTDQTTQFKVWMGENKLGFWLTITHDQAISNNPFSTGTYLLHTADSSYSFQYDVKSLSEGIIHYKMNKKKSRRIWRRLLIKRYKKLSSKYFKVHYEDMAGVNLPKEKLRYMLANELDFLAFTPEDVTLSAYKTTAGTVEVVIGFSNQNYAYVRQQGYPKLYNYYRGYKIGALKNFPRFQMNPSNELILCYHDLHAYTKEMVFDVAFKGEDYELTLKNYDKKYTFNELVDTNYLDNLVNKPLFIQNNSLDSFMIMLSLNMMKPKVLALFAEYNDIEKVLALPDGKVAIKSKPYGYEIFNNKGILQFKGIVEFEDLIDKIDHKYKYIKYKRGTRYFYENSDTIKRTLEEGLPVKEVNHTGRVLYDFGSYANFKKVRGRVSESEAIIKEQMALHKTTKPIGKGELKFPNGAIYKGEYLCTEWSVALYEQRKLLFKRHKGIVPINKRGLMPHGKGTLTLRDETVLKGQFVNGVLVEKE